MTWKINQDRYQQDGRVGSSRYGFLHPSNHWDGQSGWNQLCTSGTPMNTHNHHGSAWRRKYWSLISEQNLWTSNYPPFLNPTWLRGQHPIFLVGLTGQRTGSEERLKSLGLCLGWSRADLLVSAIWAGAAIPKASIRFNETESFISFFFHPDT